MAGLLDSFPRKELSRNGDEEEKGRGAAEGSWA